MVDIHFSGRLGNNLIQYCFGRIVADHYGYSLTIRDDNHVKEFPLVRDIKRFEVSERPVEYNDTVHPNLSLEDIFKDTRHRHIIIKGYWQKSKFYLNYREQMREWCYLPPSMHASRVDPRDVILHIRREDYLEAQSDLNFAYYDHCLQHLSNHGKVWICGVGIDSVVKKYFAKYNPIYMNLNSIEDFKLMKCFRNVVMSNSTFCWIATWISDVAERVYYPEPVSGYWAPQSEQKLFIEGFHTKISGVKIGGNK